MKRIYLPILIASLVLSCSKASEENETPSFTINTGKCTVTSDSSVDIFCSLKDVQNGMTFGIVYSRVNAEPTGDDMIAAAQKIGDDGSYTVSLANLLKYSKYYYRAYAKSGTDYYYGEADSFQIAKYQAVAGQPVDLGLSVKWANCNIGATAPEGYGDLFSWGETYPKDKYASTNYFDPDYKIYYLVRESIYNKTKFNLQPMDDAASVNWGGGWRMPSEVEMKELIDNCTWTWTVLNEVNGYKVQSKTNDNWIFLPAAGDESLGNKGAEGYYWTKFLAKWDDGYTSAATALSFSSGQYETNYCYRYSGLSIRPVCE